MRPERVMNVKRCLSRLRYSGTIEPDITTLRGLQRAFLLSVPFENLDIHRGREITLSPESVFEKIVIKRRGGVCYENNILFCELLRTLGYRVEYLSARIVKGCRTGPEYEHMVLLVALEHDYLVDVGKGLLPGDPLRLDGSTTAISAGCSYKVGPYNKGYALYSRRPGADWAVRFVFTGLPRARSEFEEMNRHHQTSPDSPFTRHRLATIATARGHVRMIDRRLTITDGSGRLERQLLSEPEYRESLRHYFGIEIDGQAP